jgi:alpha-mannosidase
VVHQAARLNQPLFAMQVKSNQGELGRSLSLLETGRARVGLMALKKGEKNDRLVIRLRELDGNNHENVELTLPREIAGAWEINGMEDQKNKVDCDGSRLKFSIGGYAIKTLAVELK